MLAITNLQSCRESCTGGEERPTEETRLHQALTYDKHYENQRGSEGKSLRKSLPRLVGGISGGMS